MLKRAGNSQPGKLRKITRRKIAPGFFVPGFLSLEIVIFSQWFFKYRKVSVVHGSVFSIWRFQIDKGYQVSKLALAVSPMGVVSQVDITDNKLSLSKMQEAVGGLVQPVGITDNLVMWVNEEFVFMPELAPNTIATAFFEAVGGSYPIHGTVLFTGSIDGDGYTGGLDNSSRDKLFAITEALDSMVQQMFAK